MSEHKNIETIKSALDGSKKVPYDRKESAINMLNKKRSYDLGHMLTKEEKKVAEEIMCELGVISGDGEFYPCDFCNHDVIAELLQEAGKNADTVIKVRQGHNCMFEFALVGERKLTEKMCIALLNICAANDLDISTELALNSVGFQPECNDKIINDYSITKPIQRVSDENIAFLDNTLNGLKDFKGEPHFILKTKLKVGMTRRKGY